MNFGEHLKELRTEAGLTQKELGKQLMLSERVLSYYESGTRFPNDPKVLIDLADYFHVSVDYLLGISPFRERVSLDWTVKINEDMALLIECYSMASSMAKGRILQFAIDLSHYPPGGKNEASQNSLRRCKKCNVSVLFSIILLLMQGVEYQIPR